MSAQAKKPEKNVRNIFEATDQRSDPHDTVDYRNKLCGHWLSHQQNDPAGAYDQTDIESPTQNSAQKLRLPTPLKNQRKHANNERRTQANKHDHNNLLKSNGQPQLNVDHMDEPFFDFDMNFNNNNNNNKGGKNNDNDCMVDGALPTTTQNYGSKHAKAEQQQQQKYDNGIRSGKSNNRYRPYHQHQQSTGHQIDMRPSNKRQKFSDQYYDDIDLDDFQADVGQAVEPQQQLHWQQQTEKRSSNDTKRINKHKNQRLHRINNDNGYQFVDDFNSALADPFDGIDKNNERPSSQFIYKRVKERSYAELMGTTPAWQKTDQHSYRRNPGQWHSNDDLVFKHPAPVKMVTVHQEKLDGHKEGNTHRRDQHERHQSAHRQNTNQQYVVSDAIEKYRPKPNDDDNEYHVLKTSSSHTATTSMQPNVFYIKCNNLVIKHD